MQPELILNQIKDREQRLAALKRAKEAERKKIESGNYHYVREADGTQYLRRIQ